MVDYTSLTDYQEAPRRGAGIEILPPGSGWSGLQKPLAEGLVLKYRGGDH